jgi:hypothetical protein
MIVDKKTSEILATKSDFTGFSIDDLNNEYWHDVLGLDATITPMTDNSISFSIIKGDIDLLTYERSIALNNTLALITNRR